MPLLPSCHPSRKAAVALLQRGRPADDPRRVVLGAVMGEHRHRVTGLQPFQGPCDGPAQHLLRVQPAVTGGARRDGYPRMVAIPATGRSFRAQ